MVPGGQLTTSITVRPRLALPTVIARPRYASDARLPCSVAPPTESTTRSTPRLRSARALPREVALAVVDAVVEPVLHEPLELSSLDAVASTSRPRALPAGSPQGRRRRRPPGPARSPWLAAARTRTGSRRPSRTRPGRTRTGFRSAPLGHPPGDDARAPPPSACEPSPDRADALPRPTAGPSPRRRPRGRRRRTGSRRCAASTS